MGKFDITKCEYKTDGTAYVEFDKYEKLHTAYNKQAEEIERLKSDLTGTAFALSDYSAENIQLKEENARLWKTIMTLTHGYCKFCVNRDKDYDESPCVDCAEDKLSLGFELDKKTLKESEDK